MYRFLKSKINRRIIKSISKIALVSVGLLAFTGLTGTYAYFTDTETAEVNVSAGVWIPTLEMSVDPLSPNGDNDWYNTSPCVTLEATGITVGSSKIYYEFSNDGDPIDGGTLYGGGCINVPDGNPTHFQAQAVNTLNPDWKSNIVEDTFKVDTTSPTSPQWIRPADNSITHQSQNILIDWEDSVDITSSVIGYEYENVGPNGIWRSVDSCGLISASQFPNSQVGPGGICIDAPAGTFSVDGDYVRRVRAIDEAGNISAWSDGWKLTRDTVKPSSSVNTFSSSTTTSKTFDVFYSASDDRAGVKNVELFYRKDGGSWESYGNFSSSPVSFEASSDGTYDFYTIAEDKADDLTNIDMAIASNGDNNLGNLEVKNPVPEATITVDSVSLNSVNIITKKVVCDNESDLPNWGNHGAAIGASTAQDYVDLHSNCHIEDDWQFQWGAAGSGSFGVFQTQTDEITNGLWHTFGSSVTINDISSLGGRIELREIFPNNGYLGFSNGNNFSAEFYCTGDVYNYDNWEWIQNLQAGNTYYCVAFNTLVAED